ncbi:MAG: hypothetical protein IKN20_09020 [Firmicutes bacterium]|nr:hypothetical protein [Bacillota bacterium]
MPNLTELKFPSRAQRRQLMEQLKALQNDPQVAASEKFRKYVENFTALDAKLGDIQEHNDEAEAFAKSQRFAESVQDIEQVRRNLANLDMNEVAEGFRRSQVEKMKEDQKDADELEKDFNNNYGGPQKDNNILNLG